MRTMRIGGFLGHRIEIKRLVSLAKGRLLNDIVVWPGQAVPLVGYMAWPNDDATRSRWINAHRYRDGTVTSALALELKIKQQHWARVADIVHLHYDLALGGHQKRRGGTSVGKAISLIATTAKSKGTGTSRLWEIWKTHKDVAHLVTAAVLISADVQTRHRKSPYGLRLTQFQPYRIAMLLPEVVLSVAMTIQDYGLQHIPYARTEPLFDPETLWRIPSDINVAPVALPVRRITTAHIAVLNARRAGNRGKAKRRDTTPVLG